MQVRKYLCIMSAKGLPEADFFPRVGIFKSPDSWVKITTVSNKVLLLYYYTTNRILLSTTTIQH